MQRKIGKHCTKFRTKLLVENDAESNVYYYHRIMVRCYYLFRGKKKYYIFKPLAEEHPFLVFLSHRPVPHRFLVAFLPTLTFAPARRWRRGVHLSPLPFIVILEAPYSESNRAMHAQKRIFARRRGVSGHVELQNDMCGSFSGKGSIHCPSVFPQRLVVSRALHLDAYLFTLECIQYLVPFPILRNFILLQVVYGNKELAFIYFHNVLCLGRGDICTVYAIGEWCMHAYNLLKYSNTMS